MRDDCRASPGSVPNHGSAARQPTQVSQLLCGSIVRAEFGDRHGVEPDECFEVMKAGLEELKIDPNRNDFFITHLHADHFGLVSRLIAASSRVYFNRPDAEIIEAWPGWGPMLTYAAENGFPEGELQLAIEQHPGFKFSSEWVPELNILQDGDIINVGEYHFRCVYTPGHSLGHTCLYEPEKKILVAGDHILIDITPNIQCWSEFRIP